ncbi:MAG: flippase-like domain-containing protein [SAR324 cluster bacterium]|uniref:Flippase-like domain-containing protein n=1 Tax=SAR324 cluster bacterium TaxID=2024889 RepID=A0A7X9FPU9_9DELT|nr:flippase-like domain-containing protein [SAR324 cluster bacterium]
MKMLLSSKKLHSGLGFLISSVILIWLFARMDWTQVLDALYKVKLWPFIPAIVLFFLNAIFRAWRWRYLLPNGEKIRLKVLYDCLMIGNLASYVLPLRAGEFVRPFMLSRKSGIQFSTTFISIVIERFFDLSLVLLSFALMVLFVPGVPEIVYQGAYALSVIAIAILIFMIIGSFFPETVMRVSMFFISILPRSLHERMEKFIRGLLTGGAVLRQGKRLVILILLSLLVWLFIYIFYQVLIALFAIKGSFWIGVAIGVITALAVAAPSAPGFIGVYQAGCVAALVLFGINEEVAVAFSIITHAFQFIMVLIAGFVSLMSNNLSFADIKNQAHEIEDTETVS